MVSFPTQTVLSTAQPYGSSIIVADFDGDGRADVAAASLYDSEISWYRNLGNGTFSTGFVISTAANSPSCIVAADIDADGRVDIVSASELDNKIAWYRNVAGPAAALFGYNPATPSANQRIISKSVEFAFSVAVADVNRDGLWDVVSASWSDSSEIAYYLNLGGGNFGWTAANPTANQHVISTAGDSPTSVAAGDLDGDGIADLAVTSSNDSTLAWFKGGYDAGGNPKFTRYVLSTDLPNAYFVAIADMNRDGNPDILSAAIAGNKVSYFRNLTQQPGATAPFFAPEQIVSSTARGVSSLAAADIDRDGNLDIVASFLGDDKIVWFAGIAVGQNGDILFGPELLVSSAVQYPASVAVGDFDADGVLDVASASQNDSKVAVYINAGDIIGDVTLPPTLTAPVSGTVATAPVVVSYTLPENALSGSVKLTFVNGPTVRELILAPDGESAGTHTFTFDPAYPGASPAVLTGSAAITDGSYIVMISYQDATGNPAVASPSAIGVIIDAVTPYLPGAGTTILARKGGVVPGAGVSGTGVPSNARFRWFGVPSINDAGRLAMTATYSAGDRLRRVIVGPAPDGTMAVLAGERDLVPDASGAVQSRYAFVSFLDVLLNDSDAVAFIATIRGVGAAAALVNPRNDRGIWTTAGDRLLRKVARENEVAAGLSARFSGFLSVALSSSFVRDGEAIERTNVAFVAKLSGAGVTPANDEGLWVFDVSATGETSTRLLLRKGQQLSLRGGAAKRIRSLVALPPMAGAAGQGRGAVPAGVLARLEFVDTTQAIVRLSGDGVIQEVAVTSDTIPDAPRIAGAVAGSDVQLDRFGLPTQNTPGDTLALASLDSPTNNLALIFAPESGVGSLAVRTGDGATGFAGAKFSALKIGVINEQQNIAFLGTAEGPGVNRGNNDGLWYLGRSATTPGFADPFLIAREGTQPPGTAIGARWKAIRSIALPDGARGPVFVADLVIPPAGQPNPARVNEHNDTGVWAVDSNGVLRLVVRESDILAGTGLRIRAISFLGSVRGSPAQTRGYNGHAELVYRATLSDGSEAIAKVRLL